MAHVTFVEDAYGDVIDTNYFCSDFCAQHSPDYGGWYGCVELQADVLCDTCEVWIEATVEG